MFNLAWSEILVIAVIAILVVGPKELPGMLRTFGQFLGKARRMAREVQTQFNDVLREAERQADLEDVRKGIDQVRSINPATQIRKSLTEVKKELSGTVDDKPMPQPDTASVASKPAAAAQEAGDGDRAAKPATDGAAKLAEDAAATPAARQNAKREPAPATGADAGSADAAPAQAVGGDAARPATARPTAAAGRPEGADRSAEASDVERLRAS